MAIVTVSRDFTLSSMFGAYGSVQSGSNNGKHKYVTSPAPGTYIELTGSGLNNNASASVTEIRVFSDNSFGIGQTTALITDISYATNGSYVPLQSNVLDGNDTLYTGTNGASASNIVTGTAEQFSKFSTIARSATDTGAVALVVATGGVATVLDMSTALGARAAAVTGSSGNDSIIAGSGADTIDGGLGSDFIAGGAGADNLTGGGAEVVDDFLFAGAASVTGVGGVWTPSVLADTAADTLSGGGGNDRYFLNSSNDIVVEAVGGGTADVVYAQTWTAAAGVEVEYIRANNLYNTAVTLTGNDFAQYMGGSTVHGDTLSGGGGNDTIDGLGGADNMSGGLGDDRFFVDNTGDVVNEVGGQGVDLVYAANWVATAGAEIEWIRAFGTAGVNLTGNDFGQQIHANGTAGVVANDVLNGGGGNDSIWSFAGADTLNGGTGNDTLAGGAGNDVFAFSTGWGADIIRDFENGADKIDMTASGATYGALQIAQSGAHTLITAGANTITVYNTLATAIDATDFMF